MDIARSIATVYKARTPYEYSKAYNPLVAISALLFLVGVIVGLYGFLKGHHAVFNVTRQVPLGILLSTYVFFVVSSTGCCLLIPFLVHAFRITIFEPFARRIVFLALATIFSGFVVLLFELEHPLKMVWNYITPNLLSNIWWMGTLYILYIIAMLCEFISLLGRNIKYAAIFGFCGAVFGVTAHSNLGGVFATLIARPYWHGPFIPIYFIASAFVSGAAITIFFTYISYKLRRKPFDQRIERSMVAVARLFGVLLFILLFFYWWEMVIGYFGSPHGKFESMMALISGPLRVNFWFFEVFLGMILPILILGFTNAQNIKAMFWASVSCIVGIFFMRYDLVVIDQLVPVWHSIGAVGYETYASYVPSIVEIAIVGGGFGFCMLLYLLAERFLDLDEVHDEDINELAEEEAKVLAWAEEESSKKREKIRGPWQLSPRMKPYESKRFKLDRAREILEGNEKEE
ncbi:MAG: polysulfide reductase NrfD [Methanomassiliicoccales archaeon]|nr:MAG: polysulfide reductase NrfD [Methanomassiliicoccales archaeon]